MPPKKTLKPVTELYADVIEYYSLEDRVTLHTLLSKGIKTEAENLKSTGEKAAEILNNLENGNGSAK